MNVRLLAVAAAALLALPACSQKNIPGTSIPDTDDTRALVALMDAYRNSVETGDVDKLVGLVSSTFRDQGGTASLDDDLDTGNLESSLRERFGRLANVRLDMDIRSIDVQPRENTAHAIFYYTLRFEMPGLTDRLQTAADLKRMDFRREDGEWRIQSGI